MLKNSIIHKVDGARNALCLVIGGCGFLGCRLVHQLIKEGFKVRVLDPHVNENSSLVNFKDDVELIAGRSSEDLDVLKKSLKDVNFLFHFAGATLPADSNKNPLQDIKTHLIENVQVIEEASKAGVQKIIFPSSGGTVYGIPSKIPINELHPTNPISSYGIAKLTTEKYLNLYKHLMGTDYIVLRYSNPYGEGQYPGHKFFGVIPTFLECLALGKLIPLIGNGEMIRDFIYIDDAMQATVKALQYGGTEKIFNIGSGIGIKINQLILLMEKITGKKAQITSLPPRLSDVPTVVLDIAKVRQELQWQPSTSLEDGILKTWNWLKQIYKL